MNYFTAGIYGDYKAYQNIKGLLRKPEDKLWILGDCLDGNSEHPEDCLKILEDIRESMSNSSRPNISLILGDHEYFHAMRLFMELEQSYDSKEGEFVSEAEDDSSEFDEETGDVWSSEIEQFEFSGGPLLEYMSSVLSLDEKMRYARFLSSLDVSEVVSIEGRLFYLCHGAPSTVGDNETQWQYNVVTGKVDFMRSYGRAMASDIRMPYFMKTLGIRRADVENAVLVTGHDFTAALEMDGETKEDGIISSNRIMAINAGASADNGEPHIVVGIDAAGWQTFEVG